MIDFLSSLAGAAELLSLNQRATMGIPSPGGEGWGECELNLRERGERHFLCCSNSNERSECRLVCCSDAGEPIYRGRQSALTCIPASGFLSFKAFYEILRLFKAI
jgi:hypothetical protein